MDRQLQKKLFEEIKGYIAGEDGNHTRLWEREHRHDASAYYDPAHHARERALLLQQPIIVGHASTLTQPGDFFAHDDTGVPILVVRQPDGSVKAFLNACRHRGARVCKGAGGNQKTFTCPYHGWAYRHDGSLLAAPRPGFPNIDPSQHGLVELPCEVRHGLVWVVLTPGKTIDIASHLGVLDKELGDYPLEGFVLERQEVRREPINWKFILDGFLEVYHIPVLHTETIAPWIYGRYSPFDVLGRHSRLLGVRKSFDEVRTLPFEAVDDFMKHVAVNYQLFPNTIIVWQGDHFEIWTSHPGKTPGECVVRVMSAVRPSMIGEQFQRRWDRNWSVLLGTVSDEDWAISREIQAALPHVKDQRLLFGRNEPGMQHFHTTLDQALAELA